MELTLSTHLLVYTGMGEALLRTLEGAGFPGLEVWLAEPHLPWKNERALEGLRKKFGDHGLRAASVHLPFYPSVSELREQGRRWSLIDPEPAERREALQGAAQGLHAAAALGADRAVLHLGWPGDAWDASAEGRAREGAAELLVTARSVGVELLLENILSTGTRTARLVALLDEIDPGGEAGVCLDLGHAHVFGGVLTELADALPRLRHVHVHDNAGDEDRHLAPGQGTIPWGDVLGQLARHGYDRLGALELRDFSRGRDPAPAVLESEAAPARRFRDHWAAQGLLSLPSPEVSA